MKSDDMIGKRFEKLVVSEMLEERDKDGRILYKCKCDCGNNCIVAGTYLRIGKRKSCGCLNKEKIKKMNNARRKHFGCIHCGSDKHYSKGYCISCYNKARRGTLE